MKTKFILSLAVVLTQALSVAAQVSKDFSTKDVFSLYNNSKGASPTAKFLQNPNGNFNVLSAPKISPLANQFLTNNSAVNCGDSSSILAPLAPTAVPCNGASVTSIGFNNASRRLVSGTDNTVGVVYRYANAGTAPDGTVLDALVTVLSYSNNQDADQTNFASADVSSATAGYELNLQPNLNQESGTFLNNSFWQGSLNYRIQFVVTGTTTPKRITVAAATTDNDGASICGSTLRESVTYSNALNQVLTGSTTTQTVAGNVITGPTTNQAGIGAGQEYANAALYINVSEINWAYSFTTPNTAACTAGAASSARYGSLNLSCQITFDRPFASVPLSGTVFNDANGLTDSTVNGTGTGLPGGTQLYANLLDANNNVVSSATVAADGTYSFPTAFTGSYNIQISTNQGVESSPAPALALPAGWVLTGENIGTAAGSDGTVNGLLPVTVASTALTNANFGIEQRPVANTNTAAGQNNLGGTNSATVPATTFSATDTAPGTVGSIRITGFPTNAASITVGGTQYTAATFPAGGVTVPTNASGNPLQAILVDPFDGAVTVAIPYIAIDNAGVASSAAGSANVPFTLAPTAGEVTIGGRVAAASNGRGISRARLSLTDSNGSVRYAVTSPLGKYRFNNVPAGENFVISVKDKRYIFDVPTQIFSASEDRGDINFVGRLSDRSKESKTENSSGAPFDFDGDNRTDVAVYRPSNQTWYILQSASGTLRVEQFAADAGALIAPADYDGDGVADLAVYNNESKVWTILQSSDGETQSVLIEGAEGKGIPAAADYDGDGKVDLALAYDGGDLEIKQSSNGETVRRASESIVRGTRAERDGGAITLRGDFDGDGQNDAATFDKGLWNISTSADLRQTQISFGLESDIPAPSAYLPKAVKSKRANR